MHPLKGVKRDPEKDRYRLERVREARPYRGKWYKARIVKGHPNAKKSGVIEEHRLLAANALGKPIPAGAVVHHHNGTMNGGQLVLCENKAYHKLLHVRQRAFEATGDPHKRKCSFCKEWDDTRNMKRYTTRNESYYHSSCHREYVLKRKAS